MGDKTDQMKGRVKEAAGSLTDDDELRREGQIDRLAGEGKEALGDAKEKVEEVIDTAKEKVEEVIDTAKDAAHRA